MLKQAVIKIIAGFVKSQVYNWARKPIETQERQLNYLIKNARKTLLW